MYSGSFPYASIVMKVEIQTKSIPAHSPCRSCKLAIEGEVCRVFSCLLAKDACIWSFPTPSLDLTKWELHLSQGATWKSNYFFKNLFVLATYKHGNSWTYIGMTVSSLFVLRKTSSACKMRCHNCINWIIFLCLVLWCSVGQHICMHGVDCLVW